MDFDKLKKEAEEKGIEKGQEELDKLKGRLGNFNSGQMSTGSTTPQEQDDLHVGPATDHNSGQMANSGHTGTTPVMDSGKAPVSEPNPPRREEQIREPGKDQEQKKTAAGQREESRREAAMEQNPASDEDHAEDAA